MADRTITLNLRANVSGLVSGFKTAHQSAKDLTKRVTDSARAQRAEWEQVGGTLTKAGAAMTAAMTGTVVAAAKWESAWAGVLKTVDGTPEQLARVEDGLRGLTRVLPSAHGEIAGVAEAAGQLGIATDNVVDFTKVMIDLGETTNLSAEEAATSLARFTNIMGTSQTDVDRLGSALVGLGNNYATTESEILALSMRLAGASRQIGLSEGEVMGLAAAMSSVGIDAEAGGTAMSLTMKRIERAVDEGGDSLETFARLSGMTSSEFQSAWKNDAASALSTFIQGLDNAGQRGESVNAILRDLGVTGIRESDALLRLSSAGTLAFDAMTQGVEEYVDATALIDEANQRYETTESKVQMAKNAIVDASIDIGAHFLPVVATAAESVASLAGVFSDLPGPVQWAVGALGGLAGTLTLGTGAVMLGLPKYLAFKDSLGELSKTAPVLSRRLGRVTGAVGKFAGLAAGVAVTAATFIKLADALGDKGVSANADRALAALNGIGEMDVDTLFLDATAGAYDLNDAMERLANPKFGYEWGMNMAESLGIGTNDALNAKKTFEELDALITGFVKSGDIETAALLFDILDGSLDKTKFSTEDLVNMLPAYQDALSASAAEAKIAADSAGELAGEIEEIDPAVQAAIDALEAWFEMAQSADASFIDLLGGYQGVIDKNIEIAQSTADATDSSKDSWEDYYDGVSVAMSDYIAALQEQVDAQRDWEVNMLVLSGRVSQGLLDHLLAMEKEGAPLVASLVDASEAELAEMERLFGSAGEDSTAAFATALSQAPDLMSAIMETAGIDAAHAAAEALASQESTLAEVVAAYDLEFIIDAETGQALATINKFISDQSGRKIFVQVDTSTGSETYLPGSGYASRYADGGPVFGPGNGTSDSVPALLSNGEHVWTAREVMLAGGHGAVSALRQAFASGQAPKYATGGPVGGRLQRISAPAYTPPKPSTQSAPQISVVQEISGTDAHEVAAISDARFRFAAQEMAVTRR